MAEFLVTIASMSVTARVVNLTSRPDEKQKVWANVGATVVNIILEKLTGDQKYSNRRATSLLEKLRTNIAMVNANASSQHLEYGKTYSATLLVQRYGSTPGDYGICFRLTDCVKDETVEPEEVIIEHWN